MVELAHIMEGCDYPQARDLDRVEVGQTCEVRESSTNSRRNQISMRTPAKQC